MGKRYKVIYADPPWQYDDKANAGERGADYKYDTMTLKDIYSLNVGDFADDNSVLFLWTTMPFLPSAISLMSAWGFKYKTVAFVWVKTPRGKPPTMKFDRNLVSSWYHQKKAVLYEYIDSMKLHWGMGSWTRANAELVLLGVRGKPHRVSKGVHSVVITNHRGIHSRKPGEVRRRIEALMGDVPMLEMFARPPVDDGWDVWGNQVDSSVDIKALTLSNLKKRLGAKFVKKD